MHSFDRFDGYRIYDGCPDSTMQKRLDSEEATRKKAVKLYPGVRATHFPMEQKWSLWDGVKPFEGWDNHKWFSTSHEAYLYLISTQNKGVNDEPAIMDR